MIKCVIWDLDNTLLDGVFLESPDQPPPANPGLAGLLHGRGRRARDSLAAAGRERV